MNPKQKRPALTALQEHPWGILPQALETIISIAEQHEPGARRAQASAQAPVAAVEYKAATKGGVAILAIAGPVFRYANLFTDISGATAIQQVDAEFTRLLNDKSVRAIVLDMDTPGGQLNGTSEFAQRVYEARGKKPVIAYASNMAASAGYWIASAAEQVVAFPTASLGSIGVVMSVLKPDDEDADVIEIVSSISPYKREDVTEGEGRKRLQAQVDKLGEMFVDVVAMQRKTDAKTVLAKYGKGAMLLADDALKAGMVDRVASLDALIKDLSAKPTITVTKTVKGSTATMSLQELIAKHPEAKEAIEAAHTLGAKEGEEKAAKAATDAERARIKTILDSAVPGAEAIATKACFEEPVSANEAAVKILAHIKANPQALVAQTTQATQQATAAPQTEADKNAAMLAHIRSAAPTPVGPAAPQQQAAAAGAAGAGTYQVNPNATDDQLTQAWTATPAIQADFMAVEDYIAYVRMHKTA